MYGCHYLTSMARSVTLSPSRKAFPTFGRPSRLRVTSLDGFPDLVSPLTVGEDSQLRQRRSQQHFHHHFSGSDFSQTSNRRVRTRELWIVTQAS